MKYFLLPVLAAALTGCNLQSQTAEKPRVLISTDIGGTDPDDNQSMAHLMMYSEMFNLQGLVSSPSFGDGSKEEILRMIDLYEKDKPLLDKHISGLAQPDSLRALCKQGQHGSSDQKGFNKPTEGSEWIVKCARAQVQAPLWVLVWGALDDVAQALHDAPDILPRIRVYWIGGPNKKWGVNSYNYIAENFPDLWIIENNATYRGFISSTKKQDAYNALYYQESIKGAGNLGADFLSYYGGVPKMGDSPSLFYLMKGEPENPLGDSWGGSFEKMHRSSKVKFQGITTEKDTVPVYSVVEFSFSGPKMNIPSDSVCFTMRVDKQDWNGYYQGQGRYMVRYSPKAKARLEYKLTSGFSQLDNLQGAFVVDNLWPGKARSTDIVVGDNWYTDRTDPSLFEKNWQGALTQSKHRVEILDDWTRRWNMLK